MKSQAAATPVVLLVLAVAAVAYAYLVDRRSVSDADRAARQRDVFPSLRIDDIARVELLHGGETLVLERDPAAFATWLMTSPRRDAADRGAVDVLLREFELSTRLRDVAEGAPLGLDSPRVTGKLKAAAVEYRFALGADAPRPEGAAYMRVEGEGTFVVAQALKVQLLRSSDAYRDRTIVALGASELARVEVRGGDAGGFALARTGTTFRVVGSGVRSSRSAVDRVLGALADTRAESFISDADADAAPERMHVTLSPTDPRRAQVELQIGLPCPGPTPGVVVVRTSPTRAAACTSKFLVEALSASAESLADTSPIYAHADEIEELRLERLGADARLDIARKGSGWHERAPEDRDLDSDESESADALALALADVRSEGPPRSAGAAPFIARARATIIRTGGGGSEAVEVAAPGAGGVALARRLDDGAILRLARSAARRFEPNRTALRGRAVWRPPFDAGAIIAVDDGCVVGGPQRIALHGGTWMLDSPSGFAADGATIAEVAGALAHLKAEAWVAETDDGTFGFDGQGSCTVTTTLVKDHEDVNDHADEVDHRDAAAGATPRRVSLVFGAEGEGGVYARTAEDAAVFVVSKSLRDLLSHPAIDRSAVRVDPSAVGSAVLTRGTARLVLERRGEHWSRDGRDGRDDGEAGAVDGRLESAMTGLYGQAALHAGPPMRSEGMDHPTLEIATSGHAGRGARITVGAPTRLGSQDAYFARVAGVDATFAVPRAVVDAILDAW